MCQLWQCILITLFVSCCNVQGVNILCLFGVPSPSHHIWNRALANRIAANGHNVTILSADIETEHPPNVHYIHMENIYPLYYDTPEPVDMISISNENILASIVSFHHFGSLLCEGAVTSKGFYFLKNYPNHFKFDLVISDFTCGPCLLGFLPKFKYPPLVSVTAFGIPPYAVDLIGGHKPYAYIPHYSLGYDVNMNLAQRILNIIVYAADALYRNYIHFPEVKAIMKKGFDVVPDLVFLEQQTILMFTNSHESIDFPEPLPPNVIPVGGLQIQKPKPLPKEINDFVEQSVKGRVLFSLGTNIRSDKLGAERLKMFLEAIEQIPQYNFIWKFESEELPIKPPKNVLISKWLPQNDILAHNKTKAFTTHAGLLSMYEAFWYGVPMIAIPFLCDQHRNQNKAVQLGVAEKLTFQTITTKGIKNTILKVLEKPRYAENMKILSTRIRDQPTLPLERATWWIEWALRNPNTDHMRSPVLKLGFLRAQCYDIILYTVITIFTITYFIKKMICGKLDQQQKSTRVSGDKNKSE